MIPPFGTIGLPPFTMGTMTDLSSRLSPPEVAPIPGPHLGLRWRAMLPSDAGAVAALVRRVEDDDCTVIRTSAEDIAASMAGGFGRDRKDSIVGIDEDDGIQAIGTVQVLGEVTERATAVIKAAIAPEWRGRGIGRGLLHWQDARARQLLIEAYGPDSDKPAVIMNWVDAHMTDRRRLYIAAGFYARRTFAQMTRPLGGSPVPGGMPDGYTVVPLADADPAELLSVHRQTSANQFMPAFSDLWWKAAEKVRRDEWSFAALDAAGHVAAFAVGTVHPDRWIALGRTECQVELIGVRTEDQDRGLRAALLEAVGDAAAADGITHLSVEVDMSGPTDRHSAYEKLGFTDERSFIFYSIEE